MCTYEKGFLDFNFPIFPSHIYESRKKGFRELFFDKKEATHKAAKDFDLCAVIKQSF